MTTFRDQAMVRMKRAPPITFANTFMRHLVHIWNLRISHPTEDILQHVDDIEAAFHRIPYHPDLGICFAYVFCEFLIVLLGTIFGAGDSPGWFGLTAEARTHLAATRDYSTFEDSLIDMVQTTPAPSTEEVATFVQAIADSIHKGILPEFSDRFLHAMFVDDNATAAIHSRILPSIRSAVGFAYDNYGHPQFDRRGLVLPLEKFSLEASVRVLLLGLVVDTRCLAVAWPLDKLRRLRSLLDDWVLSLRRRSAHEAAILLGLIRHGALLTNVGVFWSIGLQHQLSSVVRRSGSASTRKKRWWHFQRLAFDRSVLRDLDVLRRTLPEPTDDHTDPFKFWSRPIGLLIPREANAMAFSDASYGGLGGWSPTWSFMWRLSRDDLVQAGFDMRLIDLAGEDLRQFQDGFPDDERGLHINVLELLSIVINTWLVLYHLRRSTPISGGWIVHILADNTSALSWFRYTARLHHNPVVVNLAKLCQSLISFSLTDQVARFQGSHIPGVDNGLVDALSRPLLYPSADSAITVFSQLQTCRFSRLPYAAIRDSQDAFIKIDHGRARERNNNTHDSCATFFACWLQTHSVDSKLLASLEQAQVEAMMGAFVSCLLEDGGITKSSNLAMGTLVGYISAATNCLRYHYGLTHSCLTNGSLVKSEFISSLLHQQRTWKKPKDQKEHLSSDILATLFTMAQQANATSALGFLSQDSCLFDCIRLAIFSGSRLGEYGQSNLRKADGPDAFDAIPNNYNVPAEFRGKPLAFIRSDFQFMDRNRKIIPAEIAILYPNMVKHVRIRFRYDKSPKYFVFRTYNRTNHFLCPVDTCISLIRRAMKLHKNFASESELLAIFLNQHGIWWTVRGSHVQEIMQRACKIAHPDPNHYLRRHIHCLMSHCCRVTAAVALFNAGESEDVIAFRLRWNSDAVRVYLRDCYRSIGMLTSDVLHGAFDDIPPSAAAA